MIPIPHFGTKQIEFLCQDLQEQLIDYQVVNCIGMDQNRFVFLFQKLTVQKMLFFCFASPFVRFHLLNFETSHQKSMVKGPLEEYLKGTTLKSIRMINQDRIVSFQFNSPLKNFYLYCEFFSKYPNYYLTDLSGQILFSLYPKKTTKYSPPLQTQLRSDPSPSTFTHSELEALYFKSEQGWRSSKEKEELRVFFSKTFKKLKSKKDELETRLKECQNWEGVQHEADLIKANLGQYRKGIHTWEVWDWLIEKETCLSLDPQIPIQDEMALRYKKAKKLHKGILPIQSQLLLILDQISSLESQMESLETLTEEELRTLNVTLLASRSKNENEIQKTEKALPYREYYSLKGIPILVGKNAKSNEILTFRLANGNDWWLHVNGMAGSHVIIKLPKSATLDEETRQDAVQLALFHSRARMSGEGEVCITQRKFVTRLGKGKIGKVQISKHSTIFARLNMDIYKRIKMSKYS